MGSNFGCWMLDFGISILDVGGRRWVLDVGLWILNARFRLLGCEMLDFDMVFGFPMSDDCFKQIEEWGF